MAVRFESIAQFREYQKTIYDFINQELIQLPLFFENQPKLNDTTRGTNVMRQGGVAQKTIRDGSLKFQRKINESIIGFDDVYSDNRDDLNVIQYIANRLNGEPPNKNNLNVDAYAWVGNNNNLGPPIGNLENYSPPGAYIYIPFIQLVGKKEKLFLRYDPYFLTNQYETYKEGIQNLDLTFQSYEMFENLLKQDDFNFNLSSYNLTDNTGVFLPVGVKKREISKQLLRENSETNITEILPETIETKVDRFFKTWQKTKNIIPQGQEYILGNTLINNGDFSGGVGPGSFRNVGTGLEIGWPSNFSLSQNSYNSLITFLTDEVNPQYNYLPNYPGWGNVDSEFSRQSQKIIEKENPGFSPFVYASARNSPAWYNIEVPSVELGPGGTYTLSMWQAEDADFNPSNFGDLKLGNSFFYSVHVYGKGNNSVDTGVGGEAVAVDWADGAPPNASFQAYEQAVKGELVQTYQSSDLTWNRYKKTITLPQTEDGDLIDLAGNVYDKNGYGYKIYWFIGFQNSIDGIYFNSENFVGQTPQRLFAGPDIRCNTNLARQYFCGFRINRGTEISGVNNVELSSAEVQTITRVLNDCLDILEPYDFDIPVYSRGRVDSLLLAQQASAQILNLLNEIKSGLIVSIGALTDGISQTYDAFAESIMNIDPEELGSGEAFIQLGLLRDEFRIMLEGTNVASNIDALNQNLTTIFNTLTANQLANPLVDYQETPTIQKLPGLFQAPGFTSDGGGQVSFFMDNGQDFDTQGLETQLYDVKQPVWPKYGTRFDGPNIGNPGYFGTQQSWTSDDARSFPSLMRMNNNYPLPFTTENEFNPDDEFLNILGSNQISTPIAAFYDSELYKNTGVGTSGDLAVLGNPNDENGYPAVGYGPYAQPGSNGIDNTELFGNWRNRMEDIIINYLNALRVNRPKLIEPDFSKQFQGMFSVGSTQTSTYVNPNFEPLKVYTFRAMSAADLLGWIYIHTAEYSNSLKGAYNAGGGEFPGRAVSYGTNLRGDRGMNFYGLEQSQPYFDQGNDNVYLNYKVMPVTSDRDDYWTYKCYEPHWEWNPLQGRFVFRFAQPVMGTTGYSYNTQLMEFTNEQIRDWNNNHTDNIGQGNALIGERKYKFKTMHFKGVQ